MNPSGCSPDMGALSVGSDSQGDGDRTERDWDRKLRGLPPDTTLDLLCAHIETLVGLTAEQANPPATDDGSSSIRTRSDSVSSGEATPSLVAELHFGPGAESAEELNRDRVQQGYLSRRFLSKREPPISMKDYLRRLHKYCPMSTAVYLATSLYLRRMITVDGVIRLQPRNVHRLVLAGLRVAMKAVEDLSYPHDRMAKVGGVTERELSRLEISFCFLVDFELRVDARMLGEEMRWLGYGTGDEDEEEMRLPVACG
ncbi:cyclin-domain-containing protein [Aspergillus ambiguus]|uniref:putative cyclin-dependent protein kinase complex component n=1 Tax=Aspergillus ambiguus TaxID=176160 RepID=UPI003CCD173A